LPVIPATHDVETAGSQFKASPGKKPARPYLKTQVGVVTHTCGPRYLEEEDGNLWPVWTVSLRPFLKNKLKAKGLVGMAQNGGALA
jgi:hypothetical protein